MEFDSNAEPKFLYEGKVNLDNPPRQFKCGFCNVSWKATGWKSNCWVCNYEHVILTLDEKLEIE